MRIPSILGPQSDATSQGRLKHTIWGHRVILPLSGTAYTVLYRPSDPVLLPSCIAFFTFIYVVSSCTLHISLTLETSIKTVMPEFRFEFRSVIYFGYFLYCSPFSDVGRADGFLFLPQRRRVTKTTTTTQIDVMASVRYEGMSFCKQITAGCFQF